jgi:hypothetical protein
MRSHLKNNKKTFNYQRKTVVDLSLPIEYFLTIMNKNRQKLVLLGNAKQRFTVNNIKKRVISVHLVWPFLRRDYDLLAV